QFAVDGPVRGRGVDAGRRRAVRRVVIFRRATRAGSGLADGAGSASQRRVETGGRARHEIGVAGCGIGFASSRRVHTAHGEIVVRRQHKRSADVYRGCVVAESCRIAGVLDSSAAGDKSQSAGRAPARIETTHIQLNPYHYALDLPSTTTRLAYAALW